MASPILQTFSFAEVIPFLLEGKKIHKLEWEDKNIWGEITSTFLCLHKADGKYHSWILNDGDLAGTDWIVFN